MKQKTDRTNCLANYIAGAQSIELPPQVVAKAKQHILDTFGAMISGSRLEPGGLILNYVRGLKGTPEACVVGSSVVTSAIHAALANGVSAHANETDDSHAASGTHPGCAVIPAALAAAELGGHTGEVFLRAVVLGYDVGCRVARALVPEELQKRGHSSRSIGGTFGAAAAAASLAGFDSKKAAYVLCFGAQQAAGVGTYVRAEDHSEKAFVLGGMPARNGLTAAGLVAGGFTGVDNVFEGERNFLQAYSGNPRPEELVRGLGSHFEILDTSIKRFCVGSPIQSALEALLMLVDEHGIEAGDMEQLVVRLPERRVGTVDNRDIPTINLQHVLSMALIEGGISFEAIHLQDRMKDPKILEMKNRMTLIGDPSLNDESLPRQAIVELWTRAGKQFSKRLTTYRGTPENPMGAEEVEKKFRELAAPTFGGDRAAQVIAKIRWLERVTDMRELRPLLAA